MRVRLPHIIRLLMACGACVASMLAAAVSAAQTDQPIKWVINTHAHGDHFYGNPAFKAAGATSIAHRDVVAGMGPGPFSLHDDRCGTDTTAKA